LTRERPSPRAVAHDGRRPTMRALTWQDREHVSVEDHAMFQEKREGCTKVVLNPTRADSDGR